ncbi:MAG: AAA family ATPase [Oscillospiraceae bacterium]|nr:AAA family ATPase [Oscillospiraceae bacterium]
MADQSIQERITVLEEQIALLPKGSVGQKTVNGKEYCYLRWTENKKRKEKYIPADEIETLKSNIEKRKALEKELKELRRQVSAISASKPAAHTFLTNVRTGSALRSFAAPVKGFRKRDCFRALHDYLYGPQQDKVFILYGLRRTGKTTLIRQIFAEMMDEELARTAFVQITRNDTLAAVNQDLKTLEEAGFRYVFFDEVTLMEDFISGAALFSDVYAASGMKIVLSGTDSLGFLFSEDEQLFDRCILLHTTFIPYREFEQVLGVKGIDEYIRYGGTMSLGGIHYNETSTFASKSSADEYVDSAIARNIQHSLRYYQDGGHFRHLQELYEHDELTSAINRIVEDINHRFTLEVLTKDFRSNDLEISRKNLRRDREQPTDVLDRIDLPEVTERLRHLLEIRNLPEQSVELSDTHISEIREYLDLLDLTREVGVFALPSAEKLRDRTIISQPGLRYAQADALVSSLLQDQTMSDLSLTERNYVLDRIRSEIMGRMMEDIVLLETALANPKKQVFVLQFAVGEFDMVVFDPATASCEIFEIKHSTEIVPEQARHLLDPEKCAMTEHRYGPIKKKTVLYRGATQDVDGIRYVNVEEYLKGVA